MSLSDIGIGSTVKRGRRKSGGRYRFDARVKSGGKKKGRNSGSDRVYQLGAVLLLLFVLAGLGAVLFAGFIFMRGLLFTDNERFRIEKIEIIDGQVKTKEMIREYLAYEGIDTGTNLFSFNLREFEERYLKRNPLVKRISMTRILPDTLKVAIQERDPLVRLGQRNTLVADSDGFVFRLSSRLHRLPVIIGCKDPELHPGGFVHGAAERAVEVLAFCDNPRVGVRIVGIDISSKDYLLMHIYTKYGIKKAPLTWKNMEKGIAHSEGSLKTKLKRLRQTITSDRGRHEVYDATYPGSVYTR